MEDEQVGLCEPERNDEDPWNGGVILWCRQSDTIAGELEQYLEIGGSVDELLKRRGRCRARQSRKFSAGCESKPRSGLLMHIPVD